MALALALDIGGTSMIGALVDGAAGRIAGRASVPTASPRGAVDGLQRVTALFDRLLQEAGIGRTAVAGIGIGASGPVDGELGVLRNPWTLPGWDGWPIGPQLQAEFGIPAMLLGDCDVAALGEQWLGAGRDTSSMVYLTFGTGIGGALIIGGHLHRPIGSAQTEMGHMAIDLDGPECYCGARGCWEMFAAAPAIVQRARAACAQETERATALLRAAGSLEGITAALVSDVAAAGDPWARQLVEETATYIGIGLANVLTMLGPQRVVLGGGVMRGWPQFAPTALSIIQRRATVVPIDRVEVVPASLGLNAGVAGAARAILDRLGAAKQGRALDG